MKQNPDREKWNEFDWELELRKDDARVNTYANDIPKYIDLPDEDGVIMNRMRKRPDLAPAGGDWNNLGPVPYDDGANPDEESENPPEESSFNWEKTPGAAVYSGASGLARDWAIFLARASNREFLVPAMKVLCLYGKLMARSGDIIDMSLDDEDEELPARSLSLRIALSKRLLADVNTVLGILSDLQEKFPGCGMKCTEHRDALGHLHDSIHDLLILLRNSK